jgi:D-serine deaminase-like pyridoxal phosphate-dependent protein
MPSLPSLLAHDLATPAFLVDRATVQRNCDAIRDKARRAGVHFRPHVKTHKTVEIARMQLGAAAGPITVSTLAEAEFFAAQGFNDITYAVPVGPDKLARAAGLARRIERLNLLLDSFATLRALEEFHGSHGAVFDVFLKVDCGYHRAGVDPKNPESFRLAVALANSSAVRFRGLLTHAGHSYHARNKDEICRIAGEEALALTDFRHLISKQAPDELVRSIGSTPTISTPEKLADADEIRPGNYVFYDAFQAAIGSCELSQCAMSVLATVIGNYLEGSHLLIDAGALALSKDPGADHVDPACGFGVVCGLDLQPLPMKLTVLSQEHGRIEAAPEIIARYGVGTRLRIIPNHSCLTAAMYDAYHVIENGAITAQWRPMRGW